MQGRLSIPMNNRIQSFPWKNWKEEFKILNENKFKYMEWTIDIYKFYKNPIFTDFKKILQLKKKYKINIYSITCDCFMERPFWKKKNKEYQIHFQDLIKAANRIGIKYVVIPLVDNGSIKSFREEKNLIEILNKNLNLFKKYNIKVLFEIDYDPSNVLRFIKMLDKKYFGINYDTGNSASLGYDIAEELTTYGKYIKNIHLKDRILGGTTVRLGNGNANFNIFFQIIKKIKYKGILIFQTARAKKFKKDVEEILINKKFIEKFL